MGTNTKTSTSIKAYVISVTQTVTKTILLFRSILEGRGLLQDYMDYNNQLIIQGLQTWLALKMIDSFILEIACNGKVAERYDLLYAYNASDVQDESELEQVIPQSEQTVLSELIAKLESLPPNCTYRVIAILKPGAPFVKGWEATTLGDISHLSRIDTNISIHSAKINGNVVVYGYTKSNTKKPE